MSHLEQTYSVSGKKIAEDLHQLHKFSKYLDNFDASHVELHAFSDASIKAYGQLFTFTLKLTVTLPLL